MDMKDISTQQMPHHVRYSQMTPLGMSARAKKTKFMPQNAGDFTSNNNICRIPVSSALAFHDGQLSYLKFDYTNTSGQTQTFDNSAHSVIKSLRFTSKNGGQDLEFFKEYAQLHACLSDLQLSLNERFARRHEGYGLKGFYTPAINAQVAGNAGAQATALQVAATASTAANIGTGEITLLDTQTCTICLPLMGSLMGSDSKKYLPLFLTGEIMMEIIFQSGSIYGVVPAVASDFTIKNVEYHAQLIEFQSDINSSLNAMVLESGLYLHGNSWSSHYNALSAGVRNTLVSERLKSVKTVLFHFNQSPADKRRRPLARTHHGLTSFKIKVGSEYYPNNDVRGDASDENKNSEFVVETLKALGEYNNSLHSGLMNCQNFASDGNDIDEVGRAVFGMDLEPFAKANLEAGVNMVLNNPLTIEFETPSAFAINSYVHLCHDVVYNLRPDGNLTVSK